MGSLTRLTAAARFLLQDMEGASPRYISAFSTEFREIMFSLLSVAAANSAHRLVLLTRGRG